MELQVGVRKTRDAGDLTFASAETEAAYILAAHLPGFSKDEMEVAVIEGEGQISIRGVGHMACRETVITSRVAIAREIWIDCFDEKFTVPERVDLDGGIDAWFDEEEEILIISIARLLTNECSLMGEDQPAEQTIHEEGQACKEFNQEETQQVMMKEKNGESKLKDIITRQHEVKESQTLESDEYLQIMQVEAERLDQKEDEAAREHGTTEGKMRMKTEDDFSAAEKVCAGPTDFEKACERKEAETQVIAECKGSEAQNRESYESKEAREHKIPWIDKSHGTLEQRPEKKIQEEHKLPTMRRIDKEQVAMELPKTREPWHAIEVQHKYKTLDATETETREIPNVKGSSQQFQPQRKQNGQNKMKPQVKGRDRMLETEQLFESKEECTYIQIEEHKEKDEKPQVKKLHEVLLEAGLIESEKEERELKNEEKERKLAEGIAYEKQITAEYPEIRKPDIELQITEEDELPKLTGPDRVKRTSIEMKCPSHDVNTQPIDKPSQLIKEVENQQKSKAKAENKMHQAEKEERPHEKPELKETSQMDGKPQLEKTDQVIEAKHPAKLQEDKKIENMQKYQKSKDVGFPDKELKQRLTEFKEDEDGQLKGPDIEEFREGGPKILPLDFHRQNSEKSTLKVPKEMLKAGETTQTKKEVNVEPELKQPEVQNAQEQSTPIERSSHEMTRTTKFQESKEIEQTRFSASEQVLDPAQDIQSEIDEDLRQYEHEVQENKEPIVVQVCEKPKLAALPHKEVQKTQVHEFHEEDHQWIGPNGGESKTKMPLELEKLYKNLQQDADVMKQKSEKSDKKAQKQLFEIEESVKSGENEAKKEVEQPKEHLAREYKKPDKQPPHNEVSAKKLSEPKEPVQVHEKVGVNELEQILEDARKIQSEDVKKELQRHEDEEQQHEKLMTVPTNEKPEAVGLIKKEEQKPVLHELKEDEVNHWKIPDIKTPKVRESQYLLQERVKKIQKTDEPKIKAPKGMQKIEKLTQLEKQNEVKQQLEQLEGQEPSECRKSTLYPPYKKPDTTQSAKSIEMDKKHKPEVGKLAQVQEDAQALSEEQEEGLKQQEQETQEHETPMVVPAYEKPQVSTPNQVLDDEKFQSKEFEKEYQQDEQELQKQEKPSVVPTSKPKATEHARKEEPKPKVDEFKECKYHQRMGPDIERPVNRKLFEQEESLHQQEEETTEQKAEKLTMRAHKRLVEAIETAQSEEGKEAENIPDQTKKQEIHQPEDKGWQDCVNLTEKPQGHQKDEKPRLETPDQVREAKYSTNSKETEEHKQIQEQEEQDHEKLAKVQTYEKLKVVEPPELKQLLLPGLKQRLHGFKEDEDRQLKDPNIEALETIKSLKQKELSLYLQKPRKELQREQLTSKPANWSETILLASEEAENNETPMTGTLIKEMSESDESYTKPGEPKHVEAELQLNQTKETEEQKRPYPAVGTQLLGKSKLGPYELESATKKVEQATISLVQRIQPPENKQPKELEETRFRLFMEDEPKGQPEQEFKQPDDEEAQKRESLPRQKLVSNGEKLEPPNPAERTNDLLETVMEQELYRSEELEQNVGTPKKQKQPPFPSKLEDRKVPERDETTMEPSAEQPGIRGAMEPEESSLLPSADKEAIEREFPTSLQKERHPHKNHQNPDKQKTASRRISELEESAAEHEKTKEKPAPHRAQEEIERPAQEVPLKIFRVPHPMKICEQDLKTHTPIEQEEDQEENLPSPLDQGIRTLEEDVSGHKAEPSDAGMDKITKATELNRRRRFHRQCRSHRAAFPIPPSTLLSGSAFVFSVMVLVFHFIDRKKPN